MQVNFDAIVIGSGPGGGITANYLAKSGLSVLVLEAGMNADHDITKEYTSEEMLQKYKYGGLTTTIGTANINYVEGSCVGGGSEINSGLYHRTPKSVLDYWRDHLNFSSSKDEMSKLFSEIEKYLSISLMPKDHMPEASLKLKIGRFFPKTDRSPTLSPLKTDTFIKSYQNKFEKEFKASIASVGKVVDLFYTSEVLELKK